MKKPDTQQSVILLTAALLLVGFGLFRYLPILRQRSALQEKMQQVEEKCSRISSVDAFIPELRVRAAEVRRKQELFEQRIPRGRSFARLWRQIAEIMTDCQLTGQTIQPGAEIQNDRLCCIPLTIECSGTMDQMFRFLQSLEHNERLLRIEEATFENEKDFSGRVTLNAKVNVYYQPEDPDKG